MKADTFNLFHNVLDSQRAEVFNKLGDGFENWYLAGGTALALQIGHRISFDFDLFSQHKIDPALRHQIIKVFGDNIHFSMDTNEQLTFFTPSQVKVTFAVTPYKPIYPLILSQELKIENIQDIAVDKAFTIGRRGAFRDYVDLYFILSKNILFESVIRGATLKYGAMFDEKLFLEQLDYMGDISDFSIEYIAEPISEEKIHETLHQIIRTYLKEKKAAA
mgnify:CR=1 FL=1